MIKTRRATPEQQRQRILQSARECFISIGLAHTTMRDIAAKADMSLGNLYRYFENKDALIVAFVESDDVEVEDTFTLLEKYRDFKGTLGEIAKGYIRSLVSESELIIYIDILAEGLRNPVIMRMLSMDKSEKALTAQLSMADEQGRIQLQIPAAVAAATLMAFIENAALKCLVNPKYTIRKAKKEFMQLVDIVFE